jgi:acetyl-CoA acyltransferase
MSDVYIVGIDMSRFGRVPDATATSLAVEASWLALDDAGVSPLDLDAVYAGNLLTPGCYLGLEVLRQIGQTGIPTHHVKNACATGSTAIRDAWMAIKAGVYDLVLCVGAEKMEKGVIQLPSVGMPTEGVIGSGTMPSVFAELGMDHARQYGTTFEQFAKVAVKNHHHATFNPKAMYRMETPLDEVMAADMIAYPNTKLMCSANVDGAAAAILASEARVRQLGLMDRAIRIRASALASAPYAIDSALPGVNSATQRAAAQAYKMAGIGPQDLDLVELHDCFATAELLHYENLGLCAAGEAGRLIDAGDTAMGGRIPVNLSGGLLSKGHPTSATGIANMAEIALHLRGMAGARQVEGARLGLAHVVGLVGEAGAVSTVHILERV